MRKKAEELLYLLLWEIDKYSRPTFRNLTDTFESWAYRNGFLQEIEALRHRGFLEREAGPATQRICRLSEKGRLHALSGRDPEICWARPWDEWWRMVTFDVPQAEEKARAKLRRLLRNHHFGCFQKSKWITPAPLARVVKILSGKGDNVKTLTTWVAQPASGEPDRAIVEASWSFGRINELYRKCMAVLNRIPKQPVEDERSAEQLRIWAIQERAAWSQAMSADPLLPERLLPTGYLGKEAWKMRVKVLGTAAKLIQSWHPSRRS